MARFFLLLSWFSPADYTPTVAVEGAYALLRQEEVPEVRECCGLCKDGRIKHGDGHTTDCPCPDTCKCKTKAQDGTCTPKK